MRAIDYIHNIYIVFPLLKIHKSSRYKPRKPEIKMTTVSKVLFVVREKLFQQVWKLTPLIYYYTNNFKKYIF